MTYKWLKWIRVAIALVFFLFTTLLFLDFRDVYSEQGIRTVTFLQFVPSLLKFITIAGLSAIGFMIVLLLTALFGRVYCSAICPLGIFQDFISRGGRMFRKKSKRRYRYLKARNILRNAILIVSLIVAIFFSIILVNLLDPYSIYGKVAEGLFRPVGIWINNTIAHLLEEMNVFFLHLIDQDPVNYATLLFPMLVLLVLVYMAGKYGRQYCNTICPVGTFLGWISKFSLFRIQINESSCIKCGKCAFACKAGCISIKNLSVDHSRCVACFNCLTECQDNAIDFTTRRLQTLSTAPPEPLEIDRGRKGFLLALVGGIGSLAGLRSLKASALSPGDQEPLNEKPTTVPVEKTSPVSPPGSLSVDHMNSICTGCQLCVSQCPTGVLQPSSNQYGLAGYMQPFMDYNSNYCNFECIRCTEICPTGALLSVTKEDKKTLQIGKVHFIKENCVVYTENTACGSCSEHCPTQAVRMVPYKGSLTIPETDDTICVGCGACEYACPVIPYKAIYVDGNPIHETAQEPIQEKLEDTEMEEFPF